MVDCLVCGEITRNTVEHICTECHSEGWEIQNGHAVLNEVEPRHAEYGPSYEPFDDDILVIPF